MSHNPDPANDPNDAYAVSGPPTDWWTVTQHGGMATLSGTSRPMHEIVPSASPPTPPIGSQLANKKKAYER